MPASRPDVAPDRWPALMRQLLDSAVQGGETAPAPVPSVDDVVALAAHALEHHAGQARKVRATARQWHDAGQHAAEAVTPRRPTPIHPPPFVGSRSQTPFLAGKAVDRKG